MRFAIVGQGRQARRLGIAGNREFVEDGRTGRLVPIGDVRALADAILGFVRDPASARAAGEAGRRLMLAQCTNDIRAGTGRPSSGAIPSQRLKPAGARPVLRPFGFSLLCWTGANGPAGPVGLFRGLA